MHRSVSQHFSHIVAALVPGGAGKAAAGGEVAPHSQAGRSVLHSLLHQGEQKGMAQRSET